MADSHNLITIATFSQAIEAHLAQGRLDAEGVESVIADEHTIAANPLYSTAVGGVKLQVREADVDRATAILESSFPRLHLMPALTTTLEEVARALSGDVHGVDQDVKVLPNQRLGYSGLPSGQYLADVGPSVLGKYKGRSVSVELEPVGEIVIKCECSFTRWFRIVPNSFLARLDVFSGRRVLSGTRDFDDFFVVRGDGSKEFAGWLSSAEIRDSVRHLAPFVHLSLERGLLTSRSRADIDALDAAPVLRAVEIVNTLAASVESLTEHLPPSKRGFDSQ